MTTAELENLIQTQMPLARAMGVRIERADKEIVALNCVLRTNHNHIGTAFGGSLSALMILAAYCRVFIMMNGQGHVVIKKHSMEFLKPVKEDLRAICPPASNQAAQDFLKSREKKGKARINLVSEILLKDGSVACRMHGEFVALP